MFRFTPLTRLSGGALVLLALSTSGARSARAQELTTRVIGGAFMPSGKLKDWYSNGGLWGAQVSYRINNYLSGTATSLWANTGSRGADGVPWHAQSWSWDGGLEGTLPGAQVSFGESWDLAPFAGVGVGQRAFYLTGQSGSTTGLSGYGSLGEDFEQKSGHWGIRIEARATEQSFTDIAHSSTRANGMDMSYLLGISFK